MCSRRTARHRVPVRVEAGELLEVEARLEVGALEGGGDGAHRRLRREAGHRVDGDVDDVGARLGGGDHRGDRGAGGVVRVDVDRHVGQLLADRADEELRRLRREEARHVLDRDRVDAEGGELVRVVDEVLQVILRLRRVGDVARVADRPLDEAAGGARGVDAHLHVLDVVERIEDAEDVDALRWGVAHALAVDEVVAVAVLEVVVFKARRRTFCFATLQNS